MDSLGVFDVTNKVLGMRVGRVLRVQERDTVNELRILIVDDSELVRNGIRFLLSPCAGWVVCGEAGNSAEGIRKASELRPDVILLDVSMPGISGLESAPRLRQEAPQTRILVMSADDPEALLPRVLRAGANGCVDKAGLGTDLVLAIRSLCKGGNKRQTTEP